MTTVVKMQVTAADSTSSNLDNHIRVVDDLWFGGVDDFDRVLALPCQRLHQLAMVAIVVGRIVADVLCDGLLLVRQDLFGQVGGLSEGHFSDVQNWICSTRVGGG
jgi:hypothetical protein